MPKEEKTKRKNETMSDKNFKALRKQLRAVVREELPAVVSSELVANVSKDLNEALNSRLDGLTNQLTTSLQAIDTRTKEVQRFMLAQSSIPGAAPEQQTIIVPEDTQPAVPAPEASSA